MELLNEAIVFAVNAHNGMHRKGNNSPYILHPMETAVIVSTMTADPEIIAAAVLHDVLEDTAASTEDLIERFGPRVCELVVAETEDKRRSQPAEQTWLVRKQESIDFLRSCSDVAIKMICIGDKLSNLRSIYRDLSQSGSVIWDRFNQKDPEMHHWYHRSIADATTVLSSTSPWQEYDRLISLIFGERNS